MADSTHVTAALTGMSEKTAEQRAALKLKHAQKLTALMEARHDLRGVHALADFVDDSVRWSA